VCLNAAGLGSRAVRRKYYSVRRSQCVEDRRVTAETAENSREESLLQVFAERENCLKAVKFVKSRRIRRGSGTRS
jgi:hypothetical protein